jgi:hypothetical protein
MDVSIISPRFFVLSKSLQIPSSAGAMDVSALSHRF